MPGWRPAAAGGHAQPGDLGQDRTQSLIGHDLLPVWALTPQPRLRGSCLLGSQGPPFEESPFTTADRSAVWVGRVST